MVSFMYGNANSYREAENILKDFQLMGFLQAERISCSGSEKWGREETEEQQRKKQKREGTKAHFLTKDKKSRY